MVDGLARDAMYARLLSGEIKRHVKIIDIAKELTTLIEKGLIVCHLILGYRRCFIKSRIVLAELNNEDQFSKLI